MARKTRKTIDQVSTETGEALDTVHEILGRMQADIKILDGKHHQLWEAAKRLLASLRQPHVSPLLDQRIQSVERALDGQA